MHILPQITLQEWGGNKENYIQQSSNKNSTRENTYSTTGSVPLTVWGNHISKIIENRQQQITDTAIRKYYGTKLMKTPMSIFKEFEKEDTLDWSDDNIPNYLNHQKIESII